MPFWIIALGLQLALLVHAIRTDRDQIWIWILLLAPLVGALAYFIVEFLPELLNDKRAAQRRAFRAASKGGAAGRAARVPFGDSDVGQALSAAQAEFDAGDFQQSLSTLRRAMTGPHQFDPDLMLGFARAQFELGDAKDAIATLDMLRQKNPDYQSPHGHVLYARAKEGAGDTAGAIHEYEALVSYYAGPEPYVRFADLLRAQGDDARARTLYFGVLQESEQAGKLYATRHKDWVDAARAGYEATAPAGASGNDAS